MLLLYYSQACICKGSSLQNKQLLIALRNLKAINLIYRQNLKAIVRYMCALSCQQQHLLARLPSVLQHTLQYCKQYSKLLSITIQRFLGVVQRLIHALLALLQSAEHLLLAKLYLLLVLRSSISLQLHLVLTISQNLQ